MAFEKWFSSCKSSVVTCYDEHWVLCATGESPNATSETSDVLYVGSLSLSLKKRPTNKQTKNRDEKVTVPLLGWLVHQVAGGEYC